MKVIAPRTHTVIGTAVGIALILAPNIFGFSDVGGAAVSVPRIIGVLILLSELTVRGSFTGIGLVSMKAHIKLDVLMGAVLALSPWLFGFSDEEANAWLPHLVVGLLVIGYALMTNTDTKNPESSNTPKV